MKFDISRQIHQSTKEYSGVQQQQGKVLQDTDFNEGATQSSGIADVTDQIEVASTTTFDSDWQYVPTRRFAIYLQESIQQGINWAVFEPNDVFRLDIESGKIVFGDGEKGSTPESDRTNATDSYRVGAGRTGNSDSSSDED